MKVAVVEENIVVVVVVKVAVKLLVTKAYEGSSTSRGRSCNSIRVAVVKEVVQ